MPLHIERNDICNMEVDAVVLPANPWLEQGRGASRALFLAAGENELSEACEKIGYVEYGHVVMTDGFNLPARYIMHAVVPYWEGNQDAAKQLYSCYAECLDRARQCGFGSIAFPLLSSGSFKCPKAKALQIANYAINEFFAKYGYELMVNLVLYDNESLDAASLLYEDIASYIDDHYVENKDEEYPLVGESPWVKDSRYRTRATRYTMSWSDADALELEQAIESSKQIVTPSRGATLDEVLGRAGENFHEAFVRYVNDSGMKNAEIYGRAGLSKSLFSKIMCNEDYYPKKQTILSLAFALKLSLQDAEYLLMKAGHAMTDYSKFDIICKYFLEKEVYDILAINEVLFDYEQELLGSFIA